MALSNEEIFDKQITSGDESDKSDEYTVEEIIKERWNGNLKCKEYLIKWEGFPSEDNTWEPQENLYGCPEKWQLYKEKKARKSRKHATNNEDDEDLISEDDNCGTEFNKKATKRIIKHDEKRNVHSKRIKISTKSESEDSCEEGSSKKKDEMKNKIRKKKESDRKTKAHKISNKTADKVNKKNEDSVEIAKHPLMSVVEKEKRKHGFAKSKVLISDSSDECERREIQEADNQQQEMEIALPLNQDINEEIYQKGVEETMETDLSSKKEIQSQSEPDNQDDRRSRMARIKKTITKNSNFVGKWWNNIDLLPDKDLLRIPLEKKDPKEYKPIKPINEGSNDMIRVAISTDRNYGLDKWTVESIVGILNESRVDHQSSSDMETDKLNTNSFALVKFIGISLLHRVPVKLLEKTEQYNKYLNYSTTKLNMGKRGTYWNKELEKPQYWMSSKAIKLLKLGN